MINFTISADYTNNNLFTTPNDITHSHNAIANITW